MCANLQKVFAASLQKKVIAAGLHGINAYIYRRIRIIIAENERPLETDDQRVFYKHIKSMVGLKGAKAWSKQFIRGEDGTLLRDKMQINS